ncbi:MAG: hypothetical protein GC129_03765 [Proteobacteria bacterium]|nr:hypothetical protein [Pseudomonadota bacterium]
MGTIMQRIHEARDVLHNAGVAGDHEAWQLADLAALLSRMVGGACPVEDRLLLQDKIERARRSKGRYGANPKLQRARQVLLSLAGQKRKQLGPGPLPEPYAGKHSGWISPEMCS